jgi:hypothetical protein
MMNETKPEPEARVFWTGRVWQYSVKGVIPRDRGYASKRMAMAAARRAIKRRDAKAS